MPFSFISHEVARPRSNSIELMGMMTVFWEPNCWAISCRPRFPASLTWATVLCQRLLPGYSSTSTQGHLEVAEYALSPTYPLMCWIYRQIKRKEGVISGRISETPRYIYIYRYRYRHRYTFKYTTGRWLRHKRLHYHLCICNLLSRFKCDCFDHSSARCILHWQTVDASSWLKKSWMT